MYGCCYTTCVLFVKSAKQIEMTAYEISRLKRRTSIHYIKEQQQIMKCKIQRNGTGEGLCQGLVREDGVPCDQRWVEVEGTGISFDMIGLNILRRLLWRTGTMLFSLCNKNYLERMSDVKGLVYSLRVYWIQLFMQKTNDEST